MSKIIRKSAKIDYEIEVDNEIGFSILKVVLIGTHFDKEGIKENIFRRTLSTVPTINAECFLINGDRSEVHASYFISPYRRKFRNITDWQLFY